MKADTASNTSQFPTPHPRNIVSFEPSGPVALIIANETRKKPRGWKKKLMESAIVEKFRGKYPKLAQRYDILVEEGKA